MELVNFTDYTIVYERTLDDGSSEVISLPPHPNPCKLEMVNKSKANHLILAVEVVSIFSPDFDSYTKPDVYKIVEKDFYLYHINKHPELVRPYSFTFNKESKTLKVVNFC